jgi:PAS domain S-box-containing protein
MPEEFASTRKDYLDLLVSQLGDFVVVLIDLDGRFSSWHPGVERQFGYRSDEFIGEHLDLLLPAAERNKGISERELKTAAESGRASDTRWMATKTNEQVLVEGFTLGLRRSGELTGFGKILRDVTEEKKTEDRLRALARGMDQTVIIVRRWDGIITHWTAGCERLYGWTSAEAVGEICQDLLRTDFPVSLERIKQELIFSGSWNGQVEHGTREGKRLAIATNWVLLDPDDAQPPSVIETQTDVSARSLVQRELESVNERLQSMAAELERSNEELEEFARIASHDLSAPIISTRWLVDLLASRHAGQLSEDGKKIVNRIIQGLERMSNLIEGVLAHATVGRTSIGSTEVVSADEAFDSALENLRKDIETSGARITRETLPAVRIDIQALAQLFQNLLSNAIKYRRPEADPAISVSASRQDPMWLFAVKDNGIGVEPEWFERIFQAMQRSHSREISGSGIGLATCKKIVTRAGGRIWVESGVEAGSTFYFTVPGPVSADVDAPHPGEPAPGMLPKP